MKELVAKPDCVLIYLDRHGEAASIRALLDHAKVKFVDKRLSIEQFEEFAAEN